MAIAKRRKTAVGHVHKPEILRRVAEGEFLSRIAQSLGCTDGAISHVLHSDPDYIAARQIGAISRVEREYRAICSATDQISISRAREGFRAAAWFAEREFPERFGGGLKVHVDQIPSEDQLRAKIAALVAAEPSLLGRLVGGQGGGDEGVEIGLNPPAGEGETVADEGEG